MIALILSFNSFAEDPHPRPLQGWVEMHSIEPVILTWVKAKPDKELEEVPTFMVQSFKKDEKFQKFINSQKADAQGCFKISTKDWHQTWCARKQNVLAILSRGDDRDSGKINQILRSWVLTHD